MRETLSLNKNWLFKEDHKPEQAENWLNICLLHTNTVLPYNGFDEKEYQFTSTYKKTLFVEASWKNRKLRLHFEGVMTACTIKINGNETGGHLGGYTAFDVDITPYVKFGEENFLTVHVDSTEREDIPPFGKVIDFLTYGGIYREVSLIISDFLFIENIAIKTENELLEKKTLKATVSIKNEKNLKGNGKLNIALFDINKKIQFRTKVIEIVPHQFEYEVSLTDLEGLELWNIDSPRLYDLEITLEIDVSPVDSLRSRFGFRTAHFTSDGFFLNGKSVNIQGLNRHQSFPYVGYAMPWRAQKKDADILKFEMGLNLVRTSHYPQSRHFLDRCDEIGLMVIEELPGWQHIGDLEWQNSACRMIEEMIVSDRNRPSIIMWGVRINESEDNHDFYKRTNALARKLDRTRQTGGVRNLEKSEFLEDVYTMNDFIHGGSKAVLRKRDKVTSRKNLPYLITEHNGHMYPTKRFDQEERLQEQALRHLKVLNKAVGDRQISGAVGWCAFDYNTHREFGSGDRICYHGVSDMFRIPKYAAAVYSSQLHPSDKIVLESTSLFSKGERDAARVLPIYIYTNCDFVRLYKNGREIGDFFPSRSEFPHIEHPPVIIKDLVGKQLEDSEFSPKDQKTIKKLMSFVMINGDENLTWKHYVKLGMLMKKYKMQYSDMVSLFLKFNSGWGESEDIFEVAGYFNGREVMKKTYGSGSAHSLSITCDDTELFSGDWDTTRVEFRINDQYGNIMPFINEYIEFEISGPGEIIGPDKTALAGGVISTWIKSTGEKGTITVQGHCSRFSSSSIEIKVIDREDTIH